MPDLIQVADDLKTMPDQWLAMQSQNPTGVVPPYLVVAELQRRQRIRSGADKAQAPASSVSQDLLRSLQARMPPAQGLPPGSVPPEYTPPGMPPVNFGGGSSGLGSPPPNAPQAAMRMPARRMAKGGHFDDNGDWVDDEDDGSDDGEPGGMVPEVLPPAYTPAPNYSPINPSMRASTMFQGTDENAGTNVYGVRNPVPPRLQGYNPHEAYQREIDRLTGQISQKPTDYDSPEEIAKARRRAIELQGGEYDASALDKESTYLAQQALKAKPTWAQALVHWGANMMANKSPNFGVAVGEASQQGMNWVEQQRQRALALEMARLKVDSERQQHLAQYKQRVAADIARITQAAQVQQARERTALESQRGRLINQQDQADKWLAQQESARQRLIYQTYVNSSNRHMTKEAAMAGVNDPNPLVSTPSKNFLNQLAAEAAQKEKDRLATWQAEQKQRTADAQTLEGIRHGHAEDLQNKRETATMNRFNILHPGGAAGAPAVKLNDPQAKAHASSLIQDQLDQMKVVDGQLMTLDSKGNWIAAAINDQPLNTEQSIFNEAKRRATKNVQNRDYYAQDPVYRNQANRDLVAGEITRTPYNSKAKLTIGRNYVPGIGQPTPAPAAPKAPQPRVNTAPAPTQPQPAQQQQPQQVRSPQPSMSVLQEAAKRRSGYKTPDGTLWYIDPRDGQVHHNP